MTKDQLEEKKAEIEIQVRGWEADTTHPEKDKWDNIVKFIFLSCSFVFPLIGIFFYGILFDNKSK